MGSCREDSFIKVLVERDTLGQYWWIMTWDVQPVLQLSANIRCKRQGQAWGQEKSYYDNHHESNGYGRSHEKREKRHLEQLAEKEMPAGDKIVKDLTEYEKFPVLNRVPQVCTSLLCKDLMCSSLELVHHTISISIMTICHDLINIHLPCTRSIQLLKD